MTTQSLPNHLAPLAQPMGSALHRIIISQGGRQVIINTTDLVRLEGEGNYTFLHTRDGKRYLMSKTLKSYEQILDALSFVRVHKSSIVNIKYLTAIHVDPDRYIQLVSGEEIAVSRRKIKDVERFLLPFMKRCT